MGNDVPAVELGTSRTAVTIAAGYLHTCAILDDGSLKCWGHGSSGQRGYGDPNDRGDWSPTGQLDGNLLAVDSGTGRTAVTIDAGFAQPSATLAEGTVTWWGEDRERAEEGNSVAVSEDVGRCRRL